MFAYGQTNRFGLSIEPPNLTQTGSGGFKTGWIVNNPNRYTNRQFGSPFGRNRFGYNSTNYMKNY